MFALAKKLVGFPCRCWLAVLLLLCASGTAIAQTEYSYGPWAIREHVDKICDSLHWSHPDHPNRHVGRGEPLMGTSWLNRPYHASWFLGGMMADQISPQMDLDPSLLGGYRLGYDFSHYWGSEATIAWTFPEYEEAAGGSDQLYWDISLVHYPWGDARWRPYLSLGLGMAHVQFTDANSLYEQEALLHIPFGVGVKYQLKNWIALRFDALDSLVLGGVGESARHNVRFTAGLEVHFGVRPRSYWPWNPGIHYF